MELIDKINTEQLIAWSRRVNFDLELWNGKPTKRFEKWFGIGVQLINYGKSWNVYQAESIESTLILKDLRDRYYPEANSILIYKYTIGAGISVHQDKAVFSEKVVMINLVDGDLDLFGEKPSIKFKYGGKYFFILDGEVFRFNSRIPHGVPSVAIPRYSISLRIVSS